MINWVETAALYGYENQDDLVGIKRPEVVCMCDNCHKRRVIAVRVKSKIINGQMAWLCPACVGASRSAAISTKMKECWADTDYRENQVKRKGEQDYKELQAQKSKERWVDNEYRQKLETGIDADTYITKCTDRFGNQFTYDKGSFTNWKNKISITCTTCNITFEKSPLHHYQSGSCPACKLPGKLRELLPAPYVLNDRTEIAPLELDVYWPQYKIALEYHGLYWHSYKEQETSEERLRHQTKALKCVEHGIKLYQIFDFEWLGQEALIKSMLNHLFNKSQRINARKLNVINIDNDAANKFFIANHLQGYRCASATLALCNNDIIMAMSFSKHNDGYEIIRMATKVGCNVAGGASRLLHHFTKMTNNSPIYTFADLRYSTGSVYKLLGFKQLKITKPNYFYYKSNLFLSRQQCQKHKLSTLLPEFDETQSESQNMFRHKFRRVWDAGHIKLRLN